MRNNTMMLTIFLKHDQTKRLEELNEKLDASEFWTTFPPKGVEIVSWNVMMGIGQVVTLKFPAEKLRDINRAIETTAWGVFQTEFYPTYDFLPIAEKIRKEKQSSQS